MDKLKIRMGLMKGMGQDAEARRRAALKQKYGGMSKEMMASQEGLDDAGESAELPSMGGKKPEAMSITVADLPTDKWNAENKQAIDEAASDPMEDEEMQKWMAKQHS